MSKITLASQKVLLDDRAPVLLNNCYLTQYFAVTSSNHQRHNLVFGRVTISRPMHPSGLAGYHVHPETLV